MLSVSHLRAEPGDLDKLGGDVQAIVDDFKTRATAAKLPYTVFETQAAASWNAWEILTDGVKAAGSLDQQAICDSLHADGARDDVQPASSTFDPKRQQLLAEHRGPQADPGRRLGDGLAGGPGGRRRAVAAETVRAAPPRAARATARCGA